MSLVEIDLIGSNGDVIELREATGTYQLPAGLVGTGMLPKTIATIDGPGLSWIRSVRPGLRPISLPILLLTSSRTEQMAAQRRVARALKWSPAASPMLRWTAESGEQFLLDVAYQGGAETTWGSRTGSPTYTRWLLSLVAADPYWRSADPVSLPVLTTAAGTPLLPNLANLNVSPASVIGEVELANPGDVEAPIVWQVKGPWSALTLALGGDALVLDAVDSSTTLTIDAAAGTVVDQAGANRYDLLGPAPRFFELPPGASQVDIQAIGSDANTLITGYFYPRFEVVA